MLADGHQYIARCILIELVQLLGAGRAVGEGMAGHVCWAGQQGLAPMGTEHPGHKIKKFKWKKGARAMGRVLPCRKLAWDDP